MVSFIPVKFKKLHLNAIEFTYTRTDDACMDMYLLEDLYIPPLKTIKANTGIAIELPRGYEGIVRPRSSTSLRGLLVHLGTIDEEYRGDIGIIISNLNNHGITLTRGCRISQFTIKKVHRIQLIEQNELSETYRNNLGFGSSGV